MEKRQLGKTGMNVSLLGFGGAEIGYEGASLETVTKLLNQALDDGLNVIDTAECYPNSEKLIGDAVANRRDDYFLFTKCGHTSPEASTQDWSAKSLLATVEESLRRLRTDHVDLLQLHSCSIDELREGEAIEAMQKAREKGYARGIGYSGDSGAALYAVQTGAFDTLQTSLNIADQEPISLTLPEARERGMGVIVKRPVANVAWKYSDVPENPYHHAYYHRLKTLAYPFLKKPLKESLEIALRFTAFQPGVTTMIVGTKQPGRWKENAEMLAKGPLPQDQMSAIRKRWREVTDANWPGQV